MGSAARTLLAVRVFGSGHIIYIYIYIHAMENSPCRNRRARFGRLISAFPRGTFAAPQNFPSETGFLGARRSESSRAEPRVFLAGASWLGCPAWAESEGLGLPGRFTSQNPRDRTRPLVAIGEDVGEDLPAELRRALTAVAGNESQCSWSASLFPDDGLPPHEKRILSLLKADQAAHMAAVIAARKEQPNGARGSGVKRRKELIVREKSHKMLTAFFP